ncbi:MAG: NAD(P)-dependent oxidoreductase, partial [Bryobacteraceae bacterium]
MPSRNAAGVIGLGLLGSAIAERLIAAGIPVHGFDIDPTSVARFAGQGGHGESSAPAVLQCCESVMLCLPNSDVASMVLTENLRDLREGILIVDCTTGEPDSAEAAGERLSRRGVEYLDATVGGSSKQVRAGEVIVMAGGSEAAFARARPLVDSFARAAFHLGPWGSGARMKLVLNMVLGLHRAVLAEALSFAETIGV